MSKSDTQPRNGNASNDDQADISNYCSAAAERADEPETCPNGNVWCSGCEDGIEIDDLNVRDTCWECFREAREVLWR